MSAIHTTPLAQITHLENLARRAYECGCYDTGNVAQNQADTLRRQWERTRNGNRDRFIAKCIEAQQLARSVLESRARP